ncbi:MAG: rhodanese-like domain-containing protein [Acidobacteriota bacterium]
MSGRTLTLGIAGLLGLLVVGLATMREHRLASAAVPAPAPLARQAAPVLSQPDSLESVPRLSVAVLQQRMERGEVIVIDVRDIDSYVASHIAGSLHIPLSYIESELPYLRRGKPIVTYCT